MKGLREHGLNVTPIDYKELPAAGRLTASLQPKVRLLQPFTFPRPCSDSRMGFKKTLGAIPGLCQFRQRRAVLTSLGEREELEQESASYDPAM